MAILDCRFCHEHSELLDAVGCVACGARMCVVCGACQRCEATLPSEALRPAMARPLPPRPAIVAPLRAWSRPIPYSPAAPRAPWRAHAIAFFTGWTDPGSCLVEFVVVPVLFVVAVLNNWAGTVATWLAPIAPTFDPLARALEDISRVGIAIILAFLCSAIYLVRSQMDTVGYGVSVHGRRMRTNPRAENAGVLFLPVCFAWIQLLSTLGLGRP